MYDNLPFKTNDLETIKAFLNSKLLVFRNENITYDKNGEGLRTTHNKFINLTLSVNYNKDGKPIELRSKGSFHYLRNNGKHNADQLTFKEAKEFLLNFKKTFGIDLKKLDLQPPEFAVNIPIPFDIEKVVQNTFYEQRKQFINNSPGNPSKISGKTSNDYRLKIYSKYHEHPNYCEPNTLRLEYQAKKMRGLHRLGISTIHDLLSLKNWTKIKDLHLNYFRHLVLYDFNIELPKNSKYKKRASELSNPNYWEDIVNSSKKKKEYSTKYNEEVNTLNFISKKYGANMLKSILQLANLQWIENLGICANTSFYEVKKPKDAPLLKPKDAPFIECNPCNHFSKDIRLCLATGVDISMQKKNSILLSNTGLKYLEKANPEQFEFIKYTLITGKHNQYEKNIYSKISKQIRNKYFNNPARYSEQPTLFTI